MADENLWGELPQAKKITTPYKLLLQQASELEKLTDSLLTGKVVILSGNVDSFEAMLQIVAPTLGNYFIEILSVRHRLTIYPVTISSLVDRRKPPIIVSNEEDLKSSIQEILTSPKVREIISALLNQIFSRE